VVIVDRVLYGRRTIKGQGLAWNDVCFEIKASAAKTFDRHENKRNIVTLKTNQ